MSPDEKKQLKQNLKMFAQAHQYLKGKGLLNVFQSSGCHLSSEVFYELFNGQFKKKKSFSPEYDEHSVTIDGYKFFALFKKE